MDLLVSGAEVNVLNKKKLTPLVLAAQHGHATIVQVLLVCAAPRRWHPRQVRFAALGISRRALPRDAGTAAARSRGQQGRQRCKGRGWVDGSALRGAGRTRGHAARAPRHGGRRRRRQPRGQDPPAPGVRGRPRRVCQAAPVSRRHPKPCRRERAHPAVLCEQWGQPRVRESANGIRSRVGHCCLTVSRAPLCLSWESSKSPLRRARSHL
mmetsp:Transcript_42074/g.82308  ORF Transcript_42074/g.82308 Transcript_42074/m.82308 type:complete len:210 (+) Transcript_42074:915-1544(+)